MRLKKRLWSVILSTTMILAAATFPLEAAAAEDGILIDEVNFPDAEFRAEIMNYDENQDGILSRKEADMVTNVEFEFSPTTFRGIEYLPKLEVLGCNDGTGERRITELDVSHNPELKRLYCSHTAISVLDISNNLKLEYLVCSDTNLTKLNVSNNPMLKKIDCSFTNIASLDLHNNPLLEYLDCGNTNLSSLDISDNPELYYVGCYNTKIKRLDTSNASALQTLDCRNTMIESLDLSSCSLLWDLNCNDTNLTCLDISKNGKLACFHCKNTKLADLNLLFNPKLRYLEVTECPLLALVVPNEFDNSIFFEDENGKLAPYKLTLQPGQDSVDLKTIAPSIQAGKILDLKGCKKQGTVLTGLKAGQNVTYRYDYNGGFIDVTIEVSEGGGQPENPDNTAQTPTISSGEGYTTSLSEDGTSVTIAVQKDYQLEDVKVNGVSKGAVNTVTGLKTGDAVEITVSKIEKTVVDLADAVVTISADSYAYTGKYIKPSPTVMYDGKKLKKGTDYTVSYSNNKKIGTATVTVTGIGDYSGEETLEFKIIPKKVSIASVKSKAKKSLTVRWKKNPQATGYQVQWRKSSKFSSSLSKKVKGADATSTTIKKLFSKRKYYVRVRAYKVVNGKTYYGKWSTAKSVKVK
ncbi:fibronectin type III domain-containing protein [Ihubacter sp. mB4P-1]|uniref:fibronectin type III domain-containing protein n=1 Tax=Ihubacter sp. mB4P-1 TaxID=3242370 RepID=UPI003C7B42E6